MSSTTAPFDAPTTLRDGKGIAVSERRKLRPVVWWATAGGFFVALQVYLFVAWVASGDFRPIKSGVTPVPGSMRISLDVQQALMPTLGILGLYFWVYRPWRRDGRLGLNGMLVLGCVFSYWQDPLVNYTQPMFSYNAALINFGTWATHIPGWLSPGGGRNPEPLVWDIGGFIAFWGGFVILGSWLMRKIRDRWPQVGTVRLVGSLAIALIVLDIAVETLYQRSGMWVWGSTISSLSIFPGHYYQFPVYETVLFMLLCLSMSCLMYFRNDKGQTYVEHGLESVHVGSKQTAWIRTLAMIGAVNVVAIAVYALPYQWFAVHGSSWPRDIIDRSYFDPGICGAGTTYACPGPNIPIPRNNSLHISPDGKVVVPPGTKPPQPVTFKTKA